MMRGKSEIHAVWVTTVTGSAADDGRVARGDERQ